MSEERQDMLARLLLHEIEQDDLWNRTTEKYADKLAALVNDVIESDRCGESDAGTTDGRRR
jgi:hypothetical protein